jgi:nicotinate-nucleotide pyrophosphorylase (carboxylating)
MLPPKILLDRFLQGWLLEDIGRGDRTTQGLSSGKVKSGKAQWVAKEAGVIAGLPVSARVFELLDPKFEFISLVAEGDICTSGQPIAEMTGTFESLLMGERVALNLAMRLSGIATMTRKYVERIADLPVKLVDTRKTTPGLRILEKYATYTGGAINHRMGLDDAVMIKDNHIDAAGGIAQAISTIRNSMPYPLTIEVETKELGEVEEAIAHGADIIMLDNMDTTQMTEAVKLIRSKNSQIKIEASGNITLDNIREVAKTGIDYISSSAPITRSTWLDLSMRLVS